MSWLTNFVRRFLTRRAVEGVPPDDLAPDYPPVPKTRPLTENLLESDEKPKPTIIKTHLKNAHIDLDKQNRQDERLRLIRESVNKEQDANDAEHIQQDLSFHEAITANVVEQEDQASDAPTAKIEAKAQSIELSEDAFALTEDGESLTAQVAHQNKRNIAGIVTDDQTNEPLQGALITIENTKTGITHYTVSKDKGQFTYKVAYGEYKVAISLDGYLPATDICQVGKEHSGLVTFGNLTIKEWEPLYGSVEGTARDDITNEALQSVLVTAEHRQTKEQFQAASNREGRFSITVPFGEYKVALLHPGYLTAIGYCHVTKERGGWIDFGRLHKAPQEQEINNANRFEYLRVLEAGDHWAHIEVSYFYNGSAGNENIEIILWLIRQDGSRLSKGALNEVEVIGHNAITRFNYTYGSKSEDHSAHAEVCLQRMGSDTPFHCQRFPLVKTWKPHKPQNKQTDQDAETTTPTVKPQLLPLTEIQHEILVVIASLVMPFGLKELEAAFNDCRKNEGKPSIDRQTFWMHFQNLAGKKYINLDILPGGDIRCSLKDEAKGYLKRKGFF